ncbi:MAG: hypothetical protein D6732_14155 [Methanobacteriota archaeon]|nr:MAG: hypothetical protein D6732_14155 [Euryarchaeota archaeon]
MADALEILLEKVDEVWNEKPQLHSRIKDPERFKGFLKDIVRNIMEDDPSIDLNAIKRIILTMQKELLKGE